MLDDILKESARRHRHLCPRQVLGARMALYAGELLGLALPRDDKRLIITVETDGCTVDGIIAASHCRVGSRTLHILDFGKVAATFTDVHTETSFRIVPTNTSRELARRFAPQARNHWQAMLVAYQAMPYSYLFQVQSVQLNHSIAEIIGKAGLKAVCHICGEEIMNGREIMVMQLVTCKSCAGERYYSVQSEISTEIITT